MLRPVVQRFREATRAFGASTSGSIVLIWALAMIVVIGAAGGAVDYARAVNARGVIANELDAAALAGARYLSSANDVAKAKTLIKETFAQTAAVKLAGIAEVAEVETEIDNTNGVITVTASASINTAFIQLLGIDTIPVASSNEVTFGSKYVEVALVVDVTGSMKSDMDTLRTAAQSVVDELIPDGTSESESKIRISLVPYSVGVNLGDYADTVTDGAAEDDCVTERSGDEKYTDATYNYDGNDSGFFGGGSDDCPSKPEMEPLTSSRSTLTTAINKLTSGGYTAGQTGVAWGWYSLSPNWSNLWPSASTPGDYDDDDVEKYLIFMTDGDFNRYYDYGPPVCDKKWNGKYENDYYKGKCVDEDGNSYKNQKNYTEEWTEEGESEYATNESSTRAKELCTQAKKTGITLYSVYFGTKNTSAGAQVMQACATDVSTTYYFASDATNLISAFQAISSKIKGIYLSK